MATLLSESDIQQQLQEIPQWQQAGNKIQRTFKFNNFVEAIEFVKKLVEPAEQAGHHPDISISYNQVTISLTSHDVGGLTEKDFNMAKTISQLS